MAKTRMSGLLMAVVTAGCCGLGVAGAVAVPVLGATGCTPKTAADVEQAMTDAQKGCVMAEEMLPAFGLPQPALSDVKVFCDIEQIADTVVVGVINEFQPQVQSMMATRRPLALKRRK